MTAEELEYVLNAVLQKSKCVPPTGTGALGSCGSTLPSLRSSAGPPSEPRACLSDGGQASKSSHCLSPGAKMVRVHGRKF